MKQFFLSPRRIIAIVGVLLLLATIIVFNGFFAFYTETIRTFFGGVDVDWDSERMQAALLRSGDLAEEIAREGIILLHNEDVDGRPALPLSQAEIARGTINVFGWRGSGYDPMQVASGNRGNYGGWIMSGSGSGQAGAGAQPVRLLNALEQGGFEWNRELMNIAHQYRRFLPTGSWPQTWNNLLTSHPSQFFRLFEPPVESYNPTIMANALTHSDIAMVVIGRLGGEGRDLPTVQYLSTASPAQSLSPSASGDPHFEIDSTPAADGRIRHYLQLSQREEELLKHVAQAGFRKTILVLNTCNHFEMDFINDSRFGIDAAIFAGALGTHGAVAIPQILKGYRYAQIPVLNVQGQPVLNAQGQPTYTEERVYFSPSGRTINTWPRRMQYDPTFINSGQNYVIGHDQTTTVHGPFGHTGAQMHTGGTGGGLGSHFIDYEENIFMGYRYFETRAYEERHLDPNSTWYEDHVQFPFGFGLSFTEFEWEVRDITADGTSLITGNPIITHTTRFEIEMYVHNVGNWPGQDVIQVYINAPFHRDAPNPLEKAHVVLVDFIKTIILQPDERQLVRLSFDAYDFASYDTHRQAVGRTDTWDGGFVLEQGDYNIKIQTNSHDIAEMDNAVVEFNIPATLVFDREIRVYDELTNNQAYKVLQPARNRFTGYHAEAGIPIDGRASRNTAGINNGEGIRLMSRLNFKETFPTAEFAYTGAVNAHTGLPGRQRVGRRERHYAAPFTAGWFDDEDWGVDWADSTVWRDHPTTRIESNLRLTNPDDPLCQTASQLRRQLGSNFDDPLWDTLLDQMTEQDIYNIVQSGGYRTIAIANVGKPFRWNLDGPSGLNFGNQSIARTAWTAFPVSNVVAQTFSHRLAFFKGLAVGEEAGASGVGGWYAPGVNLHRGPFAGRNFEYYGECPTLAGIIAAEMVNGALQNGLYAYVKHFVGNDSETHRGGIRTWMSEQTLRELYLRPFEIAVRRGRASGIMTGFNMLGALWTGGSRGLNTYILRDEWGFRGAVVTDYWEGTAQDHMSASQGLRAGNDLWLSGIAGGAGAINDAGEHQLPGAPGGSFLWVSNVDRTSAVGGAGGGVSGHNVPSGFFSQSGRIIFRRAAKNILFAHVNSYWYANTAEPDVERFGADVWQFVSDYRHLIVEGQRGALPAWIIAVVVLLNILFFGGAIAVIYFVHVRYFIKRRRIAAEPSTDVSDNNVGNQETLTTDIEAATQSDSNQ